MNETHDTDRDATPPDHGPDGGADYLWDRSGPPDPEVVALEGALARHRWTGRLPRAEAVPPATARVSRLWVAGLTAAAAAIVIAVVWGSFGADPDSADPSTPHSPYVVEHLEGRPRIESDGAAGDALVPGARLVTDAGSRARLRVGGIGSVLVEPETRLRVDDPGASDAGYLLWLERGTLKATIFAAPRLFQVGTPSGIAVDMGCEYTASVDDAGVTRLGVTMGQVSFETPERKVLVPRGASTRAWPGRGVGTPVWDDADPAFRAAVERLDESVAAGAVGGGATADPEALAMVLATERAEDSLTLWHLLDDDGDAALRGGVYDRLVELAPPPEGVTREGCLARERDMLDWWKDTLGWSWALDVPGLKKLGQKGQAPR